MVKILHILLLTFLCACSSKQAPEPLSLYQAPLPFEHKTDDLAFEKALQKQITHLKTYDPSTRVVIAHKEYLYGELVESASNFLHLYRTYSGEEFKKKVYQEYRIYSTTGRKTTPRKSLITGYYEPVFKASPILNHPFIYPIYTPPQDLVLVNINGKKTAQRQTPQGRVVPYYTRSEIEGTDVLVGNEIAYLKDPVDVFVLHVQGSGKLQYPDGSLHSVGYAGNNGHRYKSIGKLLVDSGKMSLEETNMESIREFLNTHPEQASSILHHNPRYIFFVEKQNRPPSGSLGIELTTGRSIAIDQDLLPWQAVAFLHTKVPVFNDEGRIIDHEDFKNFMVAQDSGSAIKGAGRVDIFWGNGSIAEKRASHMKEEGQLYFLLPKKDE